MTTTPSPETTPETPPATKPRRARQKGKPGDALFGWAFAVGLIGVVGIFIGANSTDAYGYHTGSPAGGIGLLLIALVLAAFGFGRRVLHALENRGPQA
jgi:uncharacterized membrane protein YdcZ (DUF606 family)